MRFLVKATIPVKAGNELVQDEDFQGRMDRILGAIKPEAAYFGVNGGQRTVFLAVEMTDASQIPTIVEPLWLNLKADIEITPVMSKADMTKAAPAIKKAAKAFGCGSCESHASGSGHRRERATAGRA